MNAEINALIDDLGLVPGPPPVCRQIECTFEDEFEEMYRNDMRYIIRGLNPRYYRFRVREDALYASSQLSFDF